MSLHNIWSMKETIRMVSLLWLQFLLFVFPSQEMFILLVSWTTIQLVLGNIRRIPKCSKLCYFLRITLYFLPYGLPLICCNKLYIISALPKREDLMLSLFIVFVLFFVWIFCNRKALRIMVAREIIAISPYIEIHVLLLHIYNKIGAALFEELFFRGFILSINVPCYISLPTSVVLFWLSHWGLPWGSEFSNRAFTEQILIGLFSGGLFLYFRSVIPCIILHFFINATSSADLVLKIDRWHIRPDRYNDFFVDKICDDDIVL